MLQSLFWLLAYFWHFSRASLVILLDPELKSAVPSLLPRAPASHELEPNNNEPDSEAAAAYRRALIAANDVEDKSATTKSSSAERLLMELNNKEEESESLC